LMEENLLPDTPKEKLLTSVRKPHPKNTNYKVEKNPEPEPEEETPPPKPGFRPPGAGGFGMFPAGFDPSSALKNLKKADDKGGAKSGVSRSQETPAKNLSSDPSEPQPKSIPPPGATPTPFSLFPRGQSTPTKPKEVSREISSENDTTAKKEFDAQKKDIETQQIKLKEDLKNLESEKKKIHDEDQKLESEKKEVISLDQRLNSGLDKLQQEEKKFADFKKSELEKNRWIKKTIWRRKK